MTQELTLKQIYNLSVNKSFNGESGWSYRRFKSYVLENLSSENGTIMKSVTMNILMPDGLCTLYIIKVNNSNDSWDYYISDAKKE